jgi:hypothetical protein
MSDGACGGMRVGVEFGVCVCGGGGVNKGIAGKSVEVLTCQDIMMGQARTRTPASTSTP